MSCNSALVLGTRTPSSGAKLDVVVPEDILLKLTVSFFLREVAVVGCLVRRMTPCAAGGDARRVALGVAGGYVLGT